MIDIGTTDFLINVPSLPRDEFERYSTQLFDAWDRRVEQTLILPDYSISLEVEEGSVKGGGKIAVALGALYLGIGNYGSFIAGLQTIRSQVASVSEALVEHATLPFGNGSLNAKVRKRGGALSQLQRLFDKVQRGEMTAEQAMHEAEQLFGDESASSPEFMIDLKSSLESAPRFPQQIALPYESFEEGNELPGGDKKRPSRPSYPKPIPPVQQYRVEIWRESKKDKRNVRVTML